VKQDVSAFEKSIVPRALQAALFLRSALTVAAGVSVTWKKGDPCANSQICLAVF